MSRIYQHRRFAPAGLMWRGGRFFLPSGAGGPSSLLSYADGTFSRPSEARMTGLIYPDISDAWEWKAANELRQHSDNSVILEGSRTNQIIYSEAIDQAPWTNGATGITVTADQGTAPDGASDADRLEMNGGAIRRRQYEFTVGDNVDIVFSVWIKRFGGVDQPFTLAYKPKNIAAQITSAYTATSEWQRFDVYFNSATGAGNTLVGIATDGTNAVDLLVWGAQLEFNALYPSSYIRTSGATAARAADDLEFAAVDAAGFAYNDPWSVTYYPGFSSSELASTASGTTIRLFNVGSGGSNVLEIVNNAGNIIVRVIDGGISQVARTITFSRHQALTFTMDFAAATLTVSGATTGDGTSTGTAWVWPAPGTEIVYVGQSSSATAQAFGRLTEPVAV